MKERDISCLSDCALLDAAMERIPLVNVLFRPVAQVVDMLQRDPTDKLQGMNVVYCAFGGEGGAGFLGLLVSDQLCNFNGQACQVVYVPTSPLPRSGAVIFAVADSVKYVDMNVEHNADFSRCATDSVFLFIHADHDSRLFRIQFCGISDLTPDSVSDVYSRVSKA